MFGSLAGSIVFFIISNLGVFLLNGYGYSIEGFIMCYVQAIPFFQTSLIADILFTTVIFLSYDTIRNSISQLNTDIA